MASAQPQPKRHVIHADGSREEVSVERLTERLSSLCDGLDALWMKPREVAEKLIEGLCDDIRTSEIDQYAAETCAYMGQLHPDLSILAARLVISRLHKQTSGSFAETCGALWRHRESNGTPAPLITEELWCFVDANAAELDAAIDYRRDFDYDYFAFVNLEHFYLLRMRGRVIERPQHLLMRVACAIHLGDVKAAIESYDLMSRRLFTHATPTLFNAGTPQGQLSSCFQVSPSGEGIDAVFQAMRKCASIADAAGGIGLCASDYPASGGAARGTSQGLIPILRVFNQASRMMGAGAGSRHGALTAYIEPWHADVFDFLELRKVQGPEERRARDLFYGLWVPDLFMKRVEADEEWTLFCPLDTRDAATGKRLSEVWGEEFEALYQQLEAEGRGRRKVRARQLWFHVLQTQVDSGMPYIVYKDTVNRKSNQQGSGIVRCASVCTESLQCGSAGDVSACALASLSLPAFVRGEGGQPEFDFAQFQRVAKVVVKNLDRVIDRSVYPVEEAKSFSLQHRPLGVGVQGLADAFIKLRLPYESQEARKLNEEIFEVLYHAACEASCELAAAHGTYPAYEGSPASKGQLQFDLWGVQPTSGRCDWAALKAKVAQHGLRNSQLVAAMPTASTALLLGNTEGFEPLTQNLHVQHIRNAELVQPNRFLVKDLAALGLWKEDLRQRLVVCNGSVQHLEEVPEELKALYKTAWEMKQRTIVDMAADRGPFVDQSQSMSIFMDLPSVGSITSMHFYGWKQGLKTGMYYLRSRAMQDTTAAKFGGQVTTKPIAPGERARTMAHFIVAGRCPGLGIAEGQPCQG